MTDKHTDDDPQQDLEIHRTVKRLLGLYVSAGRCLDLSGHRDRIHKVYSLPSYCWRCGKRSCCQRPYSFSGLSINSFWRNDGSVQKRNIRSTRPPSLGMSLLILGCGQSVPHSTRSGAT
ncbi:hypothetical protein D3C84_600750 [compost metagenome]